MTPGTASSSDIVLKGIVVIFLGNVLSYFPRLARGIGILAVFGDTSRTVYCRLSLRINHATVHSGGPSDVFVVKAADSIKLE